MSTTVKVYSTIFIIVLLIVASGIVYVARQNENKQKDKTISEQDQRVKHLQEMQVKVHGKAAKIINDGISR